MVLETQSHKTFSNSRKCSTIRRRALNFIADLNAKEVPLETAKELFSESTGLYDRLTLKAYFGVQKFYSDPIHFEQDIEYTRTGTTVHKQIRRRQRLTQKKGYLEKMSLVSFELRGSTWFMIVNPEAVLIPQLYERKQLFMENISLSHNTRQSSRKECEKTSGCLTKELENKQQPSREIYKSVYKSVYEPIKCKNKLIEAIIAPYLNAKPIDEPDKAKTNLREVG